MKRKIDIVFKYLLLALPLIIYFGLEFGLAIACSLLYLQSYFNALILYAITHHSFNPQITASRLTQDLTGPLTEILIFVLPVLAGIFFFFWYRRLIKKENKQEPKVKLFSVKNTLLILLAALGLQLVTGGLLELVLPYFKELANEYNKLMEQITIGNPVLIFISVVIIAPVSEELTFRGVILKRARNITPFAAANIIQALLFGIAHLNIVQGIYAFGGGLAMGYVAYKFRTIKASILLHMFFNGLNFILMVPGTLLIQVLYIAVGTVLTVFTLSRIRKAGAAAAAVTESPM